MSYKKLEDKIKQNFRQSDFTKYVVHNTLKMTWERLMNTKTKKDHRKKNKNVYMLI